MTDHIPRATEASDAAFRSAIELQHAGDHQRAIAALEALCQRDPMYINGWVRLSYLRLHAGAYPQALAAAQSALRLEPDNLAGCFNAGVARYALGDLHGAHHHFTRAARIAPDNPHVHLRLGQTLAALGSMAEAIEAYVRAIGVHVTSDHAEGGQLTAYGVDGLAALSASTTFAEPLQSLCVGTRHLADGQRARAYRSFTAARGDTDEPATDVARAAVVLLRHLWRQYARANTSNSSSDRTADVIPIHTMR